MPSRASKLLLPLACLASFLVVLDAMIVTVALPAIGADLRMQPAAAPWVLNAYTLMFAGTLLMGGRCVDILGRWRVLIAGAALFTLSSLACGVAGSTPELLVCRAVQGVGAAVMLPATLSVLTVAYVEPRARARALGIWSAVAGLGAAAGPVLGGVLTAGLGWRWIFLVNVPLGAFLIVAAVALSEPTPRISPRPRFDAVGAVLATVGLVGLVFAVMRSAQTGWSEALVVASLASGVVTLGAFVVHQARWASHPLMPMDLFRMRPVAAANAVMFFVGLAFVSSLMIMSLVMQYGYGYSALRAGLGFVPVGVAMTFGAAAAGRLVSRIGTRHTTGLFCAIGAAGLAWEAVAVWLQQPYLVTIAIPGILFGLGAAATFTPLTVSATGDTAPERHGAVGGLLNTVRQTSGAIGIAVLSYVAITVGYSMALAVGAGLLVAAGAVAVATMPLHVRRVG